MVDTPASMEPDREESSGCRLLLNVSPLLVCSPRLPPCGDIRPLHRRQHHHASGATAQRCGPRATKHAAPAVGISLRDTMGPVR